MKILAIDPGGTTGIAIRSELGEIYTCVMKSPEEVYTLINPGSVDHIICENFKAQTISKYGLHTVRIVGGAYALAIKFGIGYTLHQPQDRYPFLTDAKQILDERRRTLKQPYMEHEKDALAHLLRWEHDHKQR